MNIEIRFCGQYVQFYQDEELVYETEVIAHPAYVAEGLLSALGFTVDITDTGDILVSDEFDEPFYEEDPIHNIEE